jgi:hypothetical protein
VDIPARGPFVAFAGLSLPDGVGGAVVEISPEVPSGYRFVVDVVTGICTVQIGEVPELVLGTRINTPRQPDSYYATYFPLSPVGLTTYYILHQPTQLFADEPAASPRNKVTFARLGSLSGSASASVTLVGHLVSIP